MKGLPNELWSLAMLDPSCRGHEAFKDYPGLGSGGVQLSRFVALGLRTPGLRRLQGSRRKFLFRAQGAQGYGLPGASNRGLEGSG